MSTTKVELGRRLFYDVRLSGNQTQSCASCHQQALAFTDGKAAPTGSTGEALQRNAMSLANVAWNSAQTWANPSLKELEQQALVPMFGDAPVELGMAGREAELIDRLKAVPLYRELFAKAFADDAEPINVANITRALASFQRSIVSVDTPVDRFQAGDKAAMSESAQRGMEMFFDEVLECHHCHGGFQFSTSVRHVTTPPGGFLHYFNTGLYNLDGQGAYPPLNTGLAEFSTLAADMGRFRAPSLRNVALTAPYMHDGSVASLEEVVDIYARGGRHIAEGPNAGDGARSPLKNAFVAGFTITAEQRADLLAFLRSLSDDTLPSDPKLANPWSE